MNSEDPTRQYVAFDLETTGLVAETDRVVEIGAVRFDASGRELGRFESLVHPERPMSPAAEAIHGISDAALAGAKPARDVLPLFLDYLGEARTTTLLAHNAAFDAGFLGRELALIGRDASAFAVVDTLALARRKIPEARDHRLETLARLFSLNPEGPHRALADSLRVKDSGSPSTARPCPTTCSCPTRSSKPVAECPRPTVGTCSTKPSPKAWPFGWSTPAVREALPPGCHSPWVHTPRRSALPRGVLPHRYL